MLLIAFLLFALGLGLLWFVHRQQKASGLPAGRIIYSDMSAWRKVEKSLFDAETGLTGKPDYLVRQKDQVIPVEVKSSRAADAPYDSHIFQLAAYCRLVTAAYGRRPPYGILHYSNRTYAIDFTPELENKLLEEAEEIRQREHQAQVDRSHESWQRCRACGYRSICDQKLISHQRTML